MTSRLGVFVKLAHIVIGRVTSTHLDGIYSLRIYEHREEYVLCRQKEEKNHGQQDNDNLAH
jgi:hypothetical protein